MSPEAVLMVNGIRVEPDAEHISALDRGYLLGDGLFETIRVRRGMPLLWSRHLARLRAGAAVTRIPVPLEDAALLSLVNQALLAGGLNEAVLRITVSRGASGQRGLLPDPQSSPTLVIYAAPFAGYPAELYARGMRALVSRVRRNEHSPLAGIKSLAYLDNILARQEAADSGADEALLLNTAGDLAGASAANLFLVMKGRLVTPSIACGALPGTVRGALVEHYLRDVEERPIQLQEIDLCEEAFLTSALLGVMPLTSLDARPIGAGQVGDVTKSVAAQLSQLEESEGASASRFTP